MAIGEICNREVVVARADDAVLEAARLMRQHHVGDVVVIEENGGKRLPIGILTDRDLVIDVIAPELDPQAVRVGDIMASSLATVSEDIGVFEAIQYMRSRGVRRLPVVDRDGGLAGIVTFDDLLGLLAEELDAFAKLLRREQQQKGAGSQP